MEEASTNRIKSHVMEKSIVNRLYKARKRISQLKLFKLIHCQHGQRHKKSLQVGGKKINQAN
jgi:ribosomal protein S13